MNAAKEWQDFLKTFKNSNKAEAIKFAQNMKDAQNKDSALSFLKPTKDQKKQGKARSAKRAIDNTNQIEIDLMVKHGGFIR